METIKIGEIKIKPSGISSPGESANPYYTFSGTVDTDLYKDITSNDAWIRVGAKNYDYLFCRNQVMMLTAINGAASGGFSGLTLEERQVAAKHYAVGAEDRASVYSDAELQIYWGEFINRAKESRSSRWSSAKSYISYVLPMSDSIDLAKSTNSLSHEYITYGIESFDVDGDDGLFDWLDNTSSFSGGTGYNGKSYWVEEHQNKIMTILKDGIY